MNEPVEIVTLEMHEEMIRSTLKVCEARLKEEEAELENKLKQVELTRQTVKLFKDALSAAEKETNNKGLACKSVPGFLSA